MTKIIDKAFEQATTKLKEIGEKIDDLPRSIARRYNILKSKRDR